MNAPASITRLEQDPTPMRTSAIATALRDARAAVAGTVQKQGEKSEGGGGKYKYVGHEHVVVHCRRALHEHGLTFAETSCVMIASENAPIRWRAMFELEHVSGECKAYGPYECTLPVNGKEAFIASTALDRTALLRLMGVAGSAEEDPEHNSNNREGTPTATTQQRVQQMADNRQHRQTAKSDVRQALDRHIARLGNVSNYQQLVTWAARLMAGDDGLEGVQLYQIPNTEKARAWSAYAQCCAANNINPEDTRKDYMAEQRDLVETRKNGG